MSRAQWSIVSGLAEMARLARELEVGRYLRREGEILQALARLDGQPGPDPDLTRTMQLAGADMAWQVWCETRRGELQLSLARARFERAAAEERMRHASARARAAGSVLAAEARRDRNCAESRREREGQG